MFFVFLALSVLCHATNGQDENPQNVTSQERSGKVLSVFNVVRFPNDLCDNGSGKNGTCYTTSECSSRGGTGSGSCANGYGVCCTFTLGCGGKSSENSTYFDSPATVGAGQCTATICKVNSDICQLRIDFSSFVISGPNTVTLSDSFIVSGNTVIAGGAAATSRTRCMTDFFSVTGSGGSNPSTICGTNSGQHMFVDARSDCNQLTFHLGNSAIGISKVDTRSWSLKVSQISCFDPNLPPTGCTQYFYGPTSGTVQSYNFGATTPVHLANQNQRICFRRERGLCRMCYFAATITDFQISGAVTMGGGASLGSVCCGYGSSGKKSSKGFDCLLVPGASKATGARLTSSRVCGGNFGTKITNMATAMRTAAKSTVCTKSTPFMIEFITDNWEFATEINFKGFKLGYFEDAMGC